MTDSLENISEDLYAQLISTPVSDMPMRELADASYKATDATRLFADQVMVPVISGQIRLNEYEKAFKGLYYRMVAWIRTIIALNHFVNYQGTAAAARSLFELLIDIKLLINGREEMLAKYNAFFPIEKYRVAKNIVEYCDGHPEAEMEVDNFKQILKEGPSKEEIRRMIVDTYGTTKRGNPKQVRHWSGINSVIERAKDERVGLYHIYVELYAILSWHIHSGGVWHAEASEDAIIASFGRSHLLAQTAFLSASRLVAVELHMTSAIEWLHDAIDDLGYAQGRVLVEKQIEMIREETAQD